MLGSARAAMMKKSASTPSFPSPIASYSFSEGTGTSSADSSGNGHLATLDPSMWSSSGHTGNCISNISLATSASVPSAGWLPTTAITIMAWVFQNSWSQVNRRAVGIWAPNRVDDGFVLAASRGSSAGPMVVMTTNNTNSLVLQPNQTVLSSGWHHLAATYDSATTTLAMYVDGVQTGTRTANGTLALDPTDTWLLGAGASGGVLDGRLDDVRMYNVALTPLQIAALKDVPVS